MRIGTYRVRLKVWPAVRGLLQRMVAGKELRSLERYRQACHLAYRWNGNVPNSAETAEWIQAVGEGRRPPDIEQFRDRLSGNS